MSYGLGNKIAATIGAIKERFGDDKPIVVDKANIVIYGNIPALRAAGKRRAAVYRCSIDAKDDAARELREALIAEYGPDR